MNLIQNTKMIIGKTKFRQWQFNIKKYTPETYTPDLNFIIHVIKFPR